MPRFDGTGPWGLGPGTGWGMGPCGAGKDKNEASLEKERIGKEKTKNEKDYCF
jgi:hypothetical protein